jgi:hypothetical protein
VVRRLGKTRGEKINQTITGRNAPRHDQPWLTEVRLRDVAYMEPSTVAHGPYSTIRMSAGPSTAAGPPSDAAAKAQVLADLLGDKALRHIFARQGQYEVRTIMITRQAWS